MDPENKRCASSPSPILHNSLHKYCTIPVFHDLRKIQQAILKYLYKFPSTCASNIVRHLQPDFSDLAARTINYHIKKMKDWELLEELTLKKPFPLQLTWPGKQCVQLSSLGVTDRRWVRLEKTFVVFDITEIYSGNLAEFRDNILLPGKWGKVHTTFNNWLKVIVKSRFPFFNGGTLEFRFGEYPKFCIYLDSCHGKSAEEAKDEARDQARYLENRFHDYFGQIGLEIINKQFNWTGATGTAEYETPSPVDVEKHVTIKDGQYWFDKSHGYPEMGVRTVQQAEKQFSVPYQLDEVKTELADLKVYLYQVEKRLAEQQQQQSQVIQLLKELISKE